VCGEDGLAQASAGSADAILLDLHLPDILGVTLYQALRSSGIRAPIMFITGWYLDTDHESLAEALGASGFFRKPLYYEDIARSIREVLASPVSQLAASRYRDTDPACCRHGYRQRLVIDHDSVQLHKGVLENDPSAVEALCSTMLSAVCRALMGRFRGMSYEDIYDAAVDAVLDYKAKAEQFDPARGRSLLRWLSFAAHRNVVNALERNRRRLHLGVQISRDNESSTCFGTTSMRVDRLELHESVRAALQGFTVCERRMLRLWISGERRTTELGNTAGLYHLSPLDRERHVKVTCLAFFGPPEA
jgi:CheY-like chemotaxis protein/DNA-directed RNA polymerase specialized sigma24 family protein